MSKGEDGAGESAQGAAPVQVRPFKLRFAPQRQPGRSYLSSVKPMGLPSIVKDKLYHCESDGEVPSDEVRRGLDLVRGFFRRGPRDRHEWPATSSHEYGWWWDSALAKAYRDPLLQHHICDSAWMKEQLRVHTSDSSYRRL